MPRERRARAAGRRPGVGRPSRERLPKLSPAARPICPCEHMGVFLRITVNYCARYRNYEHILTCIRKHVTCVLGELDTARDFTAIVKLVCGSALGLAGRSGWLAGLAESPPPGGLARGLPHPGRSVQIGGRLWSRFLQSESRPETGSFPRFIARVLFLGYRFSFTFSFPICYSGEVQGNPS